MGLFTGSVVDVWEALENTDEETSDVLSSSHEPTYKGVVCQFVPVSSREKLMAGIDVSAKTRRWYVKAGRIEEPSNDCVVVDLTDPKKPSYWTPYNEIENYPGTHLETVVEELAEPPDMIGAFYG